MVIYIPLCIYFNDNGIHPGIQYAFNLHSTMYLFQPRPIFSRSNSAVTPPILSISFLISILPQISSCDNILFAYQTM